MAATTDALRRCALFMRNADPRAYEAFVAELRTYVTSLTVAVTEAPQENILNAQGRAQMARQLLLIFNECEPKPQQPPPR